MPNKPSAKKELRKSVKRQVYNDNIKHLLGDLMKKTNKALMANPQQAIELLRQTLKALDKAAQKGILKKNTASRQKSRLQKRYNKTLKK